MFYSNLFFFLVSAAFAVKPRGLEVAGSTPQKIDCPNSYCSGKYDGNYPIASYKNYFVQCSNGIAYCQSCWPSNLEFSEECNQCLYSAGDECYTTKAWTSAATSFCPDMCPKKGPKYSGNVYDHSNYNHYVACWNGVTVGCVNCPGGLLYNEEYNACLYEGQYHTKPQRK